MVYKEVDHAGNISVGMAKVGEYRAYVAALTKSNVAQAKAYVAAKKAWNAETEHKGVPFPLKRPVRARRVALKTTKNEQSAKEYLKKLQAFQAKLKLKKSESEQSATESPTEPAAPQAKLGEESATEYPATPVAPQPKLGEESESFVVYKEVDHAGNISMGMATDEEYKAHCEALKEPNALHAAAYVAAEKAWNAETEHKGVPFPLKRQTPAECTELKRLNKEQAKEYLDKQEALLSKLEEEQDSLAPAELSEAERQNAERHAALLKKATILFNNSLLELSAKSMVGI